MADILRAYARAVRSLLRPSVLAHFLWPVLIAAGAWLSMGIAFWDRLARALTAMSRHLRPLASALAPGQATEAVVTYGFKVTLYLISLPLAMLTAILILESVALPFIVERIGRVEYPQIERRHGGSEWQSVRNTLVSFVLAIAVVLLTLPLWLVPGAGPVISLGLSSWLNYRSFRYDVLIHHADRHEIRQLPRGHRVQLLVIAAGASALGFLPVASLFAVPLAGLAFAHYLLFALERERATATVLQATPPG